ncbi:hypothetical protein CJ030_MR1G018339 [Morella rubra]|uniref:XS domain-containing protein n=1 Tax=Morella rubra TaxID=262757 RepID=A0A6A1WQC3_9ROSI|nr:hypothetical protein CJ030_MR1G018339 [Morella rubra]
MCSLIFKILLLMMEPLIVAYSLVALNLENGVYDENGILRFDMSYRSGKDISETKLEDYEYKYYNDLKKSCPKDVHPEPASKTVYPMPDGDEEFVYPWKCIISNIKTKCKDEKHVAECCSRLEEDLLMKGFNPVRVRPVWNSGVHSGFAIIEFKKDWAGFENAMSCAKSFEVDHFGKRDFYSAKNRGDELFGWMAHKDEYDSRCPIGVHLRKKTDVKTISAIEAEDQQKALTLVSNLTNNLEMKTSHLEEMQNEYQETNTSLSKLMRPMEKMLKAYNEDAMATLEQKRADEKFLTLAAEQKREKENLHRKIIELEKKLDAKQALELEVEGMRGALQVMKHMGDDGDMEVKTKMDEIGKDLNEKEEELARMEELNQTLIVKEQN